MNDAETIHPDVLPSGPGCLECQDQGGWWVHLRRCAVCGHVGCCDDSLGQHATAHFHATGHAVIQSFEPGERWFWNYRSGAFQTGPALAPPHHHPDGQGVPGPADRVPEDWQEQLEAVRAQRGG